MTRVRARSSRPTGELPEALRAWADHVYQCARLAAINGRPMHAALVNGTDLLDWRCQMSMRERRLIEAVMSANIWEPDP